MERIQKLNQYLKNWQRHLGLQEWRLEIKLVNFKRTDYHQSGDLEVDLKNKSAAVLITKEETDRDNAIILHELIHLLLWEYDHFCEANLPKNKKDKYFELLEKTIADLTDILIKKDN